MPLTKENMESRDGWTSYVTFRDIARMDHLQLDRYTRLAFTGEEDREFLPETFFVHWYDSRTHGPSQDGRDAPSPAVFLAGFHNILASVYRGTFTIGEVGEPLPDFEYRPRFRSVILGLLDESLALAGSPSEEQQMIASFAVESVGVIRKSGMEMRESEDAVSRRAERGIEANPQHLDLLKADIGLLVDEYPELLSRAQRLIEEGRFGELKLRYY